MCADRGPRPRGAEARRHGDGFAFDVLHPRVVDALGAGIVDPAVVLKSGLRQAASGAMMLLTTEALVLRREPAERADP